MRNVFNDTYAILFFDFIYKSKYVVGTHLNCLDLSRQFKLVSTTYAFIKK